MNIYRRDDGTLCKALKFEGVIDGENANLFQVMNILAQATLLPIYHAEETTDEWQENEAGDDYEQIVIPEHILLQANQDKLHAGDYVVERDGDIYIMTGSLFEAVWELAITDNLDDWEWHIHKRLPYADAPGYWVYKSNPDIVSRDGGLTYFKLSERPQYKINGTIYRSVPADQKVLEQPKDIPIADICEHCGKAVANFDTNGTVYKGFKHTEGRQRGLVRCWPEDTGQPYGLDATPRNHKR